MAHVVQYKDVCQEQTLQCSHLQLLQSNAVIDSCNSGAEANDLPFQLLRINMCCRQKCCVPLLPHPARGAPSEMPERCSSSLVLGFVAERLLQSTAYYLLERNMILFLLEVRTFMGCVRLRLAEFFSVTEGIVWTNSHLF